MAWTLSSSAQRASDAIASFPYDGGGPFNRAACAIAPVPHAAKLGRILRVAFPWLSARTAVDSTYGPDRCQPMVNTFHGQNVGDMSIHDVGRALDCIVPTVAGAEGESLANFCVENAVRFGIQLVIWNRSIWQPSIPRDATSPARFRPYRGPSPHTDHVHVEVTLAPGPGLIDIGEAPPIVPPALAPATSPAAVPGHSGWLVAGIGAALGGLFTWALWPRRRRRR